MVWQWQGNSQTSIFSHKHLVQVFTASPRFWWNKNLPCLKQWYPVPVQLLSHVWLFATPWTAAHQASLSITNSQSLFKLTSIEFAMPSNHLILCRPLLLPPSIFPNIRVFQMSQLFASGGQSIGVSASASVLPMNIQDWFRKPYRHQMLIVRDGIACAFILQLC